jgi:hypothetical protein
MRTPAVSPARAARGAALAVTLATALAPTLAAALAISTRPAHAFDVPDTDITVVDTHRVDGTTLVLNNAVLFEATVLAIDVYVVSLYLPIRTARPADILACPGALRLDLRFMRDVDRDQLVERWQQEVEKRARRRNALALHKPAITALFALLPGIREGQTLSFIWRPTQGLEVAVNGRSRGLVPGDRTFCALFFSGFVGPESLYPDMSEGLLAR